MMRRRGQAAVEFLTTYSWAIFILFGVVAAVYMLDLADPDRYAEPDCVLDNQVSCLEAQYLMNGGSADQLRLNLQNNYPKEIKVQNLTVELDDGDQDATNTSINQLINSGGSEIIGVELGDWDGNGYVSEEVAATLNIELVFAPTSSGNNYTKQGYTIVRPQ